jgi:hypothetical protein
MANPVTGEMSLDSPLVPLLLEKTIYQLVPLPLLFALHRRNMLDILILAQLKIHVFFLLPNVDIEVEDF